MYCYFNILDGEGSVEGYYPVVNLSTKETVANLRQGHTFSEQKVI